MIAESFDSRTLASRRPEESFRLVNWITNERLARSYSARKPAGATAMERTRWNSKGTPSLLQLSRGTD